MLKVYILFHYSWEDQSWIVVVVLIKEKVLGILADVCDFLSCPCCFSQLVSEKVGGAEGTKLDEDFKEMEKVSRGKSSTKPE